MPLVSPPVATPAIRDFTQRVERGVIRSTVGDRVVATSWWRDPTANAAVAGASGSLHLEGLAVDLDVPFGSLLDLAILGVSLWIQGLSALVYWTDNKSYVHVQARPLRGGSRLVLRRGDRAIRIA